MNNDMQWTTLDRRVTRNYVGSCSSLDRWAHVGRVAVAAQYLEHYAPEDNHDMSDVPGVVMKVRVESSKGRDAIRAALYDTFTSEGCHHEHDCCGCLSVRVTNVFNLYDNDWLVVQSRSRNY